MPISNRLFLLLLMLFCLTAASARKESRTVVRMETSQGTIRIALLNETPRHRDNFIKLVSEGFYDGTLFHRVIQDFMIQGGDPDSRNASPDKLLGDGGPGYTLQAEIHFPDICHLRGMVAAARESDDVNPEMRSSGSQFYIVWGKKMTASEAKRYNQLWADQGIEDTRFLLDEYQSRGGTPHLDGSYTVFGEVIDGLDIVKQIQSVKTDKNDRPLQNVVIKKAIIEKKGH